MVHTGNYGEDEDMFNQFVQLAQTIWCLQTMGAVMMVGVDINESEGDRVNFSKPGTVSVSRGNPRFTQPRLIVGGTRGAITL